MYWRIYANGETATVSSQTGEYYKIRKVETATVSSKLETRRNFRKMETATVSFQIQTRDKAKYTNMYPRLWRIHMYTFRLDYFVFHTHPRKGVPLSLF